MPEQLRQLGLRVTQLWERVQGYAWWEVVIELAVIWVVVYAILRFLRGTRGERVVKALALILILGTVSFRVLGGENTLERLNFLYGNFLQFISLILVIVFQPELRRALVRLGEARLWRQTGLRKERVIDEVVDATAKLSKLKIGLLLAFERQVGLRGIVEAGTTLDAEVTQELLTTLFWPNTALHDMGVVIRGDRLLAAGVQFPLAEGGQVAQELGSRHRAAIGLSQETDALIVVVSEETGTISVAERGELTRGLNAESLRRILTRGLGSVQLQPRETSMHLSADGSDASVAETLTREREDTALKGSKAS